MAKHYRTKREKAQDKVQPMTALPQYADAIGLDVGRVGFHISIPTHGMPPATWAVWYFDYEDNPDWHITLIRLCQPDTVVVAEPTGWHYLSPIANVIQRATKARLYLVDHQISGKVRAAHKFGALLPEYEITSEIVAATALGCTDAWRPCKKV